MTILSLLAVAIARSLSLEVRLAKYHAAREEAKALARSGVYLAMRRLDEDARSNEASGRSYDWLGDDWASVLEERVAEGTLRIQIADEARRLRVNTATHEELTRLIGEPAIAQAIVDARDEPDPAEDRPGDSPPYLAKNGPVAAPEELSELPGMRAEALDLLLAQTSPYTAATEPLNINTVSPEVLRAIGISESAIGMITHFREDGVFEEAGIAILQTLKDQEGVDLTGTPDGNLLSSNLFGVGSETFTIISEGLLERPSARARVTAVVKRSGCGDGVPSPCIISWREG